MLYNALDEQEKEKIQSKKSALVRQPLIPSSYTPPPKSQTTEVEDSGVSPVDGALGSIRKSMAGLRDVAKKQFQFKKKDNADKRKRRENIFRKLGEKASELGGLGLRAIKRSKAFQRVKNYFQNILLGGILLWFAKNFKNVKAWFEETRDNFEEWVRIINDLPDSVWYLVIIVFTATFSTKMTDKVLNRNKKK